MNGVQHSVYRNELYASVLSLNIARELFNSMQMDETCSSCCIVIF